MKCPKFAERPLQVCPRGTIAALSVYICLTVPTAIAAPDAANSSRHEAKVTVFSTGFNNPRGLKFGPDRNLYVAEGGTGGPLSTDATPTTPALCAQVIPPIGPYTGSPVGARISQVDREGHRTTVIDNLPSSQTSAPSGSLISGIADVAFIDEKLYAVFAGAGCSHGIANIPNGVIRVNNDASWKLVANLSAFQQANPVANPEPDDFEPDGTWYNMVAVNHDLFAVEPNHGEIVKISTSGKVSRVVDISASQGHIVPSAMTYYRGNFYVGNLGVFPQIVGSSNIYKITPGGQISVATGGFDMVLGLAFDNRGRMYVLEMTAGNAAPVPNTGKVTRVDPSGARVVIADQLLFPTGMTLGPDGDLYVSNVGFGLPAVGLGQILKIELPD
jgi:hypothetical protein